MSFLTDPVGFNRRARDFWLKSAREMKVCRDGASGDPTVELCVQRARMFHGILCRLLT